MKSWTWKDADDRLVEVWRVAASRSGSFADAPWEPAKDGESVITPMYPFEREGAAAMREWIRTGTLPATSSAASRWLEIRFICAAGFAREIASLPSQQTPDGWSLDRALEWLLLDVSSITTQVAIDHIRLDVLMAKE